MPPRCCRFYKLKAKPSTCRKLGLTLLRQRGTKPVLPGDVPVLKNYLKGR